MKKELRHIIYIIVFALIGMMLGYMLVNLQHEQIKDPEYLAVLASHNFPIPEPMEFKEGMASLAFIFSGIPTGSIIYRYLSNKWFTSMAPKIILAVFLLPFFIGLASICAPFMVIYKLFLLIKRNKFLRFDFI